MTMNQLEKAIEQHFASGPAAIGDHDAMAAFLDLRSAIESGEVRAASPVAASPTGWRVNAWVKRGILLGFRLGAMEEMAAFGLSFVDKNTYPARHFDAGDGVRLVPGGSSVRAGACVARGVVCMPPMYINACAYVDEATMVDSHALVGRCARSKLRSTIAASVPSSFNAIEFADNTVR
jgi:2,3,4,5-tetrahydropyridine-2-carboxylate N-succinyltransferase